MKAMACKTSFELHHHFPKLAEESGFTFNTHRPRIHIDWNKIRLIDIDSLIKERKFIIIEQHLNDILDCVFESEFDVRILDEGVMKMFRLAQLAVEYQQFCRHYLDRSVYVLREEITSLAQQLDICKKELREKDEEIRRLRKRSRHSFKTPLPYGNDNIATMILKTLSHKGDYISSPSNNTMHYNKCNYCDKVFLNQLYLKSHLSRRHPNVIEAPQKDKTENNSSNDNIKLGAEIIELKNKIIEMQNIITTKNEVPSRESDNESKITAQEVQNINNNQEIKKDTKDAVVSTDNEGYLLHKIEEWKKQEHENYNKEMDKFRIQILETINTIKEKENSKTDATESNLIVQLNETIKQQEAEILALKKEINDSRIRTEKENTNRNKEAEAQISFWSGRVETQSKQYELLLQKLNEVARDAKESRALAEAERERATQLNVLLQQSLNSGTNINMKNIEEDVLLSEKQSTKPNVTKKSSKTQADLNRSDQKPDSGSLEKLHRKAQELLNIASISSSSSDTSSVENYVKMKSKPLQIKSVITNDKTTNENNKIGNNVVANKSRKNEKVHTKNKQEYLPRKTKKMLNGPKLKKETSDSITSKNTKHMNGSNIIPGSPMKLVRAKITEEVNTRLASAGVDPLKSRLPRNVFEKQRNQIQHQQELKIKKNPAHEKARHSILAFLDSSVPDFKKDITHVPDYISPTKLNKPFRHLTSVISNVKTKALSLVKLNDLNGKEKQISKNSAVAKRAMSLLKTPTSSASSSPLPTKRSSLGSLNTTENVLNDDDARKTGKVSKKSPKIAKMSSSPSKMVKSYVPTSNSEDVSEESDHKYHTTTAVQHLPKTIETLIKSPARRPSSAAADYNNTIQKHTISDDNLLRTQSVTNLINETIGTNEAVKSVKESASKLLNSSSDSTESYTDIQVKKNFFDDGAPNTVKQTKSVLKNASSTSSLNKKKVLFDMDAIQMKSVSASPSQSLTEKSDGNEKYELGLVNLDSEEWDISSIDNEPLKNDTRIQNITRTSPKITELKEKIESQLARRVDTPTTALVGGVDVLPGRFNLVKTSSVGGSNTSLGSSILDDSESLPITNHKTVVRSKKAMEEATSDINVSGFNKNKNKSF